VWVFPVQARPGCPAITVVNVTQFYSPLSYGQLCGTHVNHAQHACMVKQKLRNRQINYNQVSLNLNSTNREVFNSQSTITDHSKSLRTKLLTNYVHLHFVLIHCINSETGPLDWTKTHVVCCTANRESVDPTSAGLPSLIKHCRLTRSTIELVSGITSFSTQAE